MIRRSASTSTPASTMTRRPPASSISIRRFVECAVALSDEAATDATGPPSAITALTNPASDLVRFAAKALRQVTSRERDKPYRSAVAATRRGSDRLSKTIRAFLLRPAAPPACINHFKSIQSTDRLAVHTYSSQPSAQPAARRLPSEAYALNANSAKQLWRLIAPRVGSRKLQQKCIFLTLTSTKWLRCWVMPARFAEYHRRLASFLRLSAIRRCLSRRQRDINITPSTVFPGAFFARTHCHRSEWVNSARLLKAAVSTESSTLLAKLARR